MLDTFGDSCGIVAIRPVTRGKVAALRRLREYWGELGFTRLEATKYFFHDTAFVRPTVSDVVGGFEAV